MADAGLKTLLEDMARAPAVYRPSPFWVRLAAEGMRQLDEAGFDHFKRTLNMHYFNWNAVGILRHQFWPVFRSWVERPTWSVFRAQFQDHRVRPAPGVKTFNPLAAAVYTLYVAMLWEYVARQDPLGLLPSLEEPACGHPFRIWYQERWVSQDLCNSVHEYYSACHDAAGERPAWDVAELGAGYGRLAYVFLKGLLASTYCVIDIPPALYIAQRYLTTVLPRERVFVFRPFRRFEEVQQEFDAARIRFLAAHQIELLPPKRFDLMLNISSLHEMTFQQIAHYLGQIDRLCRGRFYMKQWKVSRATVNRVVVTASDYPIPASWTTVYHRQHPIQQMFFEALYDVGGAGCDGSTRTRPWSVGRSGEARNAKKT